MNFRKTALVCLAGIVCTSAIAVAQTTAPAAQMPSAPSPQTTAPAPPPGAMKMTLREAEALALRNNPQISVGKLLALAQHQVTREARSVEFPNAAMNLTAVEPHPGSRIAAGGLNNPVIYERAAGGVTLSQLITDFGRTRNLVSSASFREKAQDMNAQATVADITLAVDQAFYAALRAQALLNVAVATEQSRQVTADQVQALANAKLKSALDLAFANVDLAQAKLQLLDAQNAKQEAFANLNTLLGFDKQQTYLLVDETGGTLPQPPQNADDEIALALRSRPDLAALNDQWESADRFRRAEHDLWRPTLSALGTVGDTPIRVNQLSPWFGAVGVNLNIPLFNGFLYSARAKEADFRTQAVQQQVRDLRDRIARDVQVTLLQAQSAYQRIAVTEQLLRDANMALDLAQTRYRLGLSSIVELTQAQLQQTQAQIGNTNARYDYEATLSTLRFQTGQ